jgi:serralysin
VQVFSGATRQLIYSFMAYDPLFRGGIHVAAGDVDGDGRADILTGAGAGGGPHVRVFSGRDGAALSGVMAYDPRFAGGVFVAASDVNGDGRAEIVTGPGRGGGALVHVFNARTAQTLFSLRAFPAPAGSLAGGWQSGVRVAGVDADNDGFGDIVVASGRGQGPRTRVFSGTTQALIEEFDATDPTFLGGIFVGGM